MKKIQNICLLLLIVLVSSCYSSKINYNGMNSVQRGMSQDEVIAVLGKPTFKSFNDEGEMLEFRDNDYSTAKTVRIWFVNDKVTEMKSYLDKYKDNKENKEEKNSDDEKKK